MKPPLPAPSSDAAIEPAATPPKPVVLSKEDRLEAENLALRAQVLTLERSALQNEAMQKLAKNEAELVRVQSAIKDTQARLQSVYGIDFTTQQIEPGTGKIIRAGK